jgi:hypothetical protein
MITHFQRLSTWLQSAHPPVDLRIQKLQFCFIESTRFSKFIQILKSAFMLKNVDMVSLAQLPSRSDK